MKVWIKSKGKLLGPIEDTQVSVALNRGIIGKDALVSDNRTEWFSLNDLISLRKREKSTSGGSAEPVESAVPPPPAPPAFTPQPPTMPQPPLGAPYAQFGAVAKNGVPGAMPAGYAIPGGGNGFVGGNFCTSCGKPVVFGASICPYCGCNPMQGMNFCQGCGSPLHPGQELCLQCGRRQGVSHAGMAYTAFFLSLVPPAIVLLIWYLVSCSISSEQAELIVRWVNFVLGIVSPGCMIAAFVISIVALVKISHNSVKQGLGLAISALVISSLELIFGVIFSVIYSAAIAAIVFNFGGV